MTEEQEKQAAGTFYYDLAKFEVQAVAQRNQAMLVFQSILFVAVESAAKSDGLSVPPWVFIGVGLAAALLWVYLNWLTYVVENKAMDELAAVDDRLNTALSARNGNWLLRVGSVSKIMSFGFPLLVLLSWLVFAFFFYCR